MNLDNDSGWLEHWKTMDEIKEESVEIKEEPFDDMADIKQEDQICYSSHDVKDEIEDINEDFEDFTVVKQEQPILNGFNAIEYESVEIKNKNDFIDIKEEELSTLPIADVFCPSTGDSRPLTIHIDKGMHSISQMAPRHSTFMKATKTIIVTGPGRVSRVIKLDRSSLPCIGMSSHDEVASSTAPIAPKRPCIDQNKDSPIPDCTTCKNLDPNSDEIEQHIPLKHPERIKRQMEPQRACSICGCSFSIGVEMNNHVRSMHTERPPPMKCDFCDDFYREGSGMEYHVRMMHSTPIKRSIYNCTFCDAITNTGDEMDTHMRSMHPRALQRIKQRLQLKKCDYCDNYYKMGSGMENHLRSRHLEAWKRLCAKCAFCDSYFKMGPWMENHVRTMHPHAMERQCITCAFCDAVHDKGADMEMHVRSVHPETVESIHSAVSRLPRERGSVSKDAQLAAGNNLPISAADIVAMPLIDFQKLLTTDSLSEWQRELIRKIRTRGKNRLVARRNGELRELARTEPPSADDNALIPVIIRSSVMNMDHSESSDEIKEESVEIKEEPFDDMTDFTSEDVVNYASDDVRYEKVEIKENLEYFADFKEEEPIIDGFDAVVIKNKDPIIDFVDTKEEELSTLPIADVFCPSTGDSRPLTIDIDNGMQSRSQIAPPRLTIMNATNTIIVKGAARVNCDAVIKLDRNLPSTGISTLNKIASSTDPIAPKQPRIEQNGASAIPDCTTCKYLDPNSDEMKQHIRLWHPERIKRDMPPLIKCGFCDNFYRMGSGMALHLRITHSNLTKRKFIKCYYCDDFYMTGDEMETHKRSIHSDELEKIRHRTLLKKCAFCDYFFTMGADMDIHVLSAHPYAATNKRSLVADHIDWKWTMSSSRLSVTCDLCGALTCGQPYFVSPTTYRQAEAFYNDLIQLTPDQRKTADTFLKNMISSLICGKHIKNFVQYSSDLPNSKAPNVSILPMKTTIVDNSNIEQ